MSLPVEGKNVVLEAKKLIDGEYQYVGFACATSVDFFYETEMIEKATVGMAGHRSWTYGMSSWGGSLQSVTHAVGTNNMLTVFDTLLYSLRKTGLDIRLKYEDNNGNLQVITGHILIPKTGIASPVDGFSEDTIDFIGNGTFALTTTIIDPDDEAGKLMTFDVTSAGGELTITVPDTINRELITFTRDGIGQEVLTSGTPLAKQVKHDASTGVIYLPNATNPDEWLFGIYQ